MAETKQKILIISYYYAPANMIGAVRMTKISKYLHSMGYPVKVITSKNSSLLFTRENGGNDQILADDVSNIDVMRVEHSGIYRKIAAFIRNHAFRSGKVKTSGNAAAAAPCLKKKILHYGMYIMSTIQDHDFARQAMKSLKKMQIRDSVIISTYGPLGSHLLARKLRKNNIWIADFRDPISQAENYPLERKINRIYEKHIIKDSDAVVGVADAYLNTILRDSSKERNVITNGFDSMDLKYIPDADRKDFSKLQFCYTGTLYSGLRDITPLFRAIQELDHEGRIDKKNIELVYAGDQGDYITELAQKYELPDMIVNMGFVSRKDSLKIQKNADVIVCLTWNVADNIGYLPGKFLEHLMFRKEILGMVTGPYIGSDMKDIMASLNNGLCIEEAEPDAPEKLKEYVYELYNKHFHQINQEKVDEFDYQNITKKYLELIVKVAAAKKH